MTPRTPHTATVTHFSILSAPWKTANPSKNDSASPIRKAPFWARPGSRVFKIAMVVVFAASVFASAEEPALNVYEILPEHLERGELGELILKISNPPGRTYYILGSWMTDVPYVIEIERNGKWVTVPRDGDLAVPQMRPFLPASYLLFTVNPPDVSSLDKGEVTFRVRAFLYTDSAFTNPYTDLTKRPFIEVVSKEMSTKDFAPRESAGEAPRQ
jgi:hypothetical protein